MLPIKSTVLQVAIVLTVFCGSAHAQTLDHLPGYKFEAKNISFLKTYKVHYDRLECNAVGSYGIQRRLIFHKGKKSLTVKIYFCQSKKLTVTRLIKYIAYHPKLSVASQYVKNVAKKVGIGDIVYTYSKSSEAKVIHTGIIYARYNVVVEIDDETENSKMNLRPLAEQIDNDIKSKTLISYKGLKNYQPQIDELTLQKTVLKSSEETELTVKISDPNKRSFKRYFQSVGSVRKKNGKEYLVAPLGPHKGELKVIVVNDHMLYSEKTVKFTVLK